MNTSVWMLYSLFLLVEPNERLVFEGMHFQSKSQCIYVTKQNILQISKLLVSSLNSMYGENSWETLEIGCVEKDGDPKKRIPIINKNYTKDPEGTLL